MKTVVLAASKGGVGKTTLATCLAVEAARTGKVAMLDLDPQGSLQLWWRDLRGEPDNPMLLINPALKVSQGAHTTKIVEGMAREASRAGFDWLIVDTPPALMLRIEPAIRIADLVVVPVRPSFIDVAAIDPVLEMCADVGCPFVFVINANPPRSGLTAGMVKLLSDKGDVLGEMISNRTSFAGAYMAGKTAAEVDKGDKAEDEIRALWGRVSKMLAGGRVASKKGAR